MHDRTFTAISTRAAASLNRRASLIGLLGAARTPALALTPASAKKKGKNKNKNKESNKDSLCKEQEEMCESSLSRFCPQFVDPEECEALLRPCCADLRTCEVDAALICILTESSDLSLPEAP